MVHEKNVLPQQLDRISHELMFQKYMMSKDGIKKFMRQLSLPEYIAMNYIISSSKNHPEEKVYLRDLAEAMKLEMHQVSEMVGSLKERELVIWSHDGNGKGGTYVVITDYGWKALQQQEAMLSDYYRKIIGEFGVNEAIHLVKEMRRLEAIMSEAIREPM